MAKKKHSTPKHLDYLFERKTITKSQYEDFWGEYWKKKPSRRDKYVDRFVSELQLELPMKKRGSGTITISLKEAERQAKEIGGYVIRRNAAGKFSKTGRTYQAVVRRKK